MGRVEHDVTTPLTDNGEEQNKNWHQPSSVTRTSPLISVRWNLFHYQRTSPRVMSKSQLVPPPYHFQICAKMNANCKPQIRFELTWHRFRRELRSALSPLQYTNVCIERAVFVVCVTEIRCYAIQWHLHEHTNFANIVHDQMSRRILSASHCMPIAFPWPIMHADFEPLLTVPVHDSVD